MSHAVKSPRPPRTRRAQQAELTRHRILDAATALFADVGYAPTTIEAIAARADVAVETVYGRFRSKANLLDAILGPAIAGGDNGLKLLDRPEVAEVRATTDQRQQVRLLARFSRTILQRTALIHQIMQTAAASDPNAAELQRLDSEHRCAVQRAYIDMLLTNGPLRAGVTPPDAADTYAALANPTTYAFLAGERGWSPVRYETWLAESLARLLLP